MAFQVGHCRPVPASFQREAPVVKHGRYKFNNKFKYDVNGWRAEARRYKCKCGELLTFFGFLEFG